MRFILLLALLVSTANFANAFTPSSADEAPDFPMTNIKIDHKDINALSDLRGKVVYLDFWASWCVPCRRSFPWMNAMHSKYKKQDLVIIAINLDQEPELAKQFLAELPAAFHIEYNPSGSIAEKYQLLGMPSSYLIDKNGVIRVAHAGFFQAKQARYEAQISALLAE